MSYTARALGVTAAGLLAFGLASAPASALELDLGADLGIATLDAEVGILTNGNDGDHTPASPPAVVTPAARTRGRDNPTPEPPGGGEDPGGGDPGGGDPGGGDPGGGDPGGGDPGGGDPGGGDPGGGTRAVATRVVATRAPLSRSPTPSPLRRPAMAKTRTTRIRASSLAR